MQIKYPPLINVEAKIERIEVDLDGNVTMTGRINGRAATLTMPPKEAAMVFKKLKEENIEGLARVHGS